MNAEPSGEASGALRSRGLGARRGATCATGTTAAMDARTDTRPVVLVVDDDASVRTALVRILRSDDYHVLTAHDAAAGMTLLDQQAVDVVVSDQRMPGQKGTDFLAAVRDRYPHVVRIVLSGAGESDDIDFGMRTGTIDRLLRKPLEPAQLRAHVQEAFAQAAAVRSAAPPPALRDALTGLPSAAYMQRVFGSLRRETRATTDSICLVLLRIEGCGHALERFAPEFNDHLVCAAARLLRRGLAPNVFLCPQPPDAFVVLTADADARSCIDRIGLALHELFASEVMVRGQPMTLAVRVGATIADETSPFGVLVDEARAAAGIGSKRAARTVPVFERTAPTRHAVAARP